MCRKSFQDSQLRLVFASGAWSRRSVAGPAVFAFPGKRFPFTAERPYNHRRSGMTPPRAESLSFVRRRLRTPAAAVNV